MKAKTLTTTQKRIVDGIMYEMRKWTKKYGYSIVNYSAHKVLDESWKQVQIRQTIKEKQRELRRLRRSIR